jgi:hypothetical protein
LSNGKTKNNIKIVQLILIILGISTIIVGFLASGPRLVEIVTKYISADKILSEQTTALLFGVKIKIISTGVVFLLLSFLVRLFIFLRYYLTENGQIIIERTASFLTKIVNITFKAVCNEKFLWGFIIAILLCISLPTVFMSSAGGFHVEGVDLQQPKNLVRHGLYATLTTEGFDTETHRTSAGPGILMPIALAFKLFGIGPHVARFVHLAFVIGAIILFYVIVRDIFDKKVALFALIISVPPYFIMLSHGDTGMGPEGYIPSTFYLLLGAYFWFKSIDTKKNIHLILSGVFWALAFQTKWLFLFAIAALIVTFVILSFTKNSLNSKYYIVPTFIVVLVTTMWITFRIWDVGLRLEIVHLWKFLHEHGHRAGMTTSVFSIFHPIIRAFTDNVAPINFWQDLQLFLIVPSIVYAIILIRRTKWTDYKCIFFMSFALIWFCWWLLFNADLPETHLRAFLIISHIFVAKFLYDLWGYSSKYKDRFINLVNNPEDRKNAIFYVLRIAIVFIVLGKAVPPLIEKGVFLYRTYTNLTVPYNGMMSYIKENTEKNAIFSGWTWSVPWYVDLDDKLDHIVKVRSNYPMKQRERVPEYFIVSPEWPLVKISDEFPSVVEDTSWSHKQNELRKQFVKNNCTLLKTFGGKKHKWLLYKVNNNNLAELSHQ